MAEKIIKILEINGSPRGFKGNTAKLVSKILGVSQDEAKKLGYDLKIKRIELVKLNMKRCLGCENCYREGHCVLSKTDDLGQVENDLRQADVIIFSSPVYFYAVSGLMKSFLDRIALWTHVFELRNKYGLAVSTTANTGLRETLDYLELTLRALGTWSVGKAGSVFYNKKKMNRVGNKFGVKLIQKFYEHNDTPNKSDYLIFQAMKMVAQKKKSLPYDWNYWNERNWFELKHFSEEN